jgi:hypothetical protein
LNWSDKNEDLKERVHYMDLYEQALMDFKTTINNINTMSGLKTNPESKAIYLSLSLKTLKDMEHDLFELGHEIGIPTAQVKRDIENARKGGKVQTVARSFRKDDDDDNNNVIQIRKRKMSRIKPKRKSIKRCRCKK